MIAKWYENKTCAHDIVISSRVRLARNLEEFPFEAKLDHSASEKIAKMVKDSLSKTYPDLTYTGINSLGEEKYTLVEEHIISPDFAGDSALEKMLITDKTGNLSVMVGEEDHIRIQSIFPGYDIDKAYELANNVDDTLSDDLTFAFDDKFGYLTACPTNLGTGLRASVMLHLPAMCTYGYIKNLSELMSKIGLTVRGLYGEGSDGKACMYQLSNQVTLGISEKDAIEKLKNAVNQIIDKERSLRKSMLEKKDYDLADKLWRSYGTLKYARSLDTSEAARLISNVLFASNCGIIKETESKNLVKLLFEIMPYHISTKFSDATNPKMRDFYRASYVREYLN